METLLVEGQVAGFSRSVQIGLSLKAARVCASRRQQYR